MLDGTSLGVITVCRGLDYTGLLVLLGSHGLGPLLWTWFSWAPSTSRANLFSWLASGSLGP